MCSAMATGWCGDWFCIEIVRFKGHKNVRAAHRTTVEITREPELTPRGDCIIGVSADKGLRHFSSRFKEMIRVPGALVIALILTEHGDADIIKGFGDPGLSLDDPDRIIIRKSSYVAPNTVMVRAGKAAKDLNRSLVEALRGECRGLAVFIVIGRKAEGFGEAPEILVNIEGELMRF